jgi:hypothetical protein
MSRSKFNRNAVASSRGSYVRKSHFLLIQEELAKRGFDETLEDIMEVSVSVRVRRKCYIKCFGKLITITEEEAAKLDAKLVIRL